MLTSYEKNVLIGAKLIEEYIKKEKAKKNVNLMKNKLFRWTWNFIINFYIN